MDSPSTKLTSAPYADELEAAQMLLNQSQQEGFEFGYVDPISIEEYRVISFFTAKAETPMLMFSASEVARFHHTNPDLRLGQAFHQYFNLEKITNPDDKAFCDKLYQCDGDEAKAMIAERTDHSQ